MLGLISNSLFAGVYAWFDLQFPVCRGLCLVRSPIPCLQGFMLGLISSSMFAGVHAWFDLQFHVCRGLCLVRSPIPCLQRICASLIIIIIMYIYHALINALSAHMIHINLNMIFYTHVKHSPTLLGLIPESRSLQTPWRVCSRV